jgi:hypothetical protein
MDALEHTTAEQARQLAALHGELATLAAMRPTAAHGLSADAIAASPLLAEAASLSAEVELNRRLRYQLAALTRVRAMSMPQYVCWMRALDLSNRGGFV